MVRIGIDLGGTNIVAGVVNEENVIIAKAECKTNLPRPYKAIFEDMAALSKKAVENAGLTMDDVKYVGVGCPGTCNVFTGLVEYSCNLDFKEVPLQEELSAMVGKPVYIENDANAAALGEAVAGAAKGAKNALCITLGTGVGGGIIDSGKVFKGFNSAAGELGHIVIEVDGRPCSCGRNGCWEAYSSATGLIKTTQEKMAECEKNGRKTILHELAKQAGKVNGRIAFDGKRAGDEASCEVVDEYIKYLASGLATIINIFQPEVLSIGGGISNEGQYLLDLVTPLVISQIYGTGTVPTPSIRIATLRNDAGIIGAAVLGL